MAARCGLHDCVLHPPLHLRVPPRVDARVAVDQVSSDLAHGGKNRADRRTLGGACGNVNAPGSNCSDCVKTAPPPLQLVQRGNGASAGLRPALGNPAKFQCRE